MVFYAVGWATSQVRISLKVAKLDTLCEKNGEASATVAGWAPSVAGRCPRDPAACNSQQRGHP